MLHALRGHTQHCITQRPHLLLLFVIIATLVWLVAVVGKTVLSVHKGAYIKRQQEFE